MDKKQVVTKLKNTCLTITPVPYYKTPTHNHINITIRAIIQMYLSQNPCNLWETKKKTFLNCYTPPQKNVKWQFQIEK